MRRSLLLIVCILIALSASSNSIQSDLDSISALMGTKKFEEAKVFALEAKLRNDKGADNFWLAKSNYYLGYLYTRDADYGKAIIYYLEAIRYAKDANYTDAAKDITSLHFRCGVIFGRFKANMLAEEYYLNGLEYAKLNNESATELNINYHLAGLYKEDGRYSEAIELLKTILPETSIGTKWHFDIANRLALTHYQSGDYITAIEIHENIIADLPEDDFKKLGSSYHNLARAYKALKDYENASIGYSQAIEAKTKNNSSKSLFSSFFGIAETYFGLKDYEKAGHFFQQAENLIDLQPNHPDYFELYKFCANLHFTLKDYELSKHYEDLYAERMTEFLKIQTEVQSADQRYNLELITKRYFDQVDKQEREARILNISKVTSGTLLFLLIVVIGYHRYQKVSLRKSIEKELIALKIID